MERNPQVKLASPTERMELILLGIARRSPVRTLCLQAGISRELFYRWMKKVRKAALLALEAQPPGPKMDQGTRHPRSRVPSKSQDRVRRLERDLAKTRKERERFKLLFQTAQRSIQGRAWGPIPKTEVKKNGMQHKKFGKSTAKNGPGSRLWAPKPGCLPNAGASTAPPTGDGSKAGANQERPGL